MDVSWHEPVVEGINIDGSCDDHFKILSSIKTEMAFGERYPSY
jgi:hypothetical protein